MIIIGIPTLNEADNISFLTTSIDKALVHLHQDAIIVNADNDSEDGTSQVFLSTITKSKKVSIVTKNKGKGYNVLELIKFSQKEKLCESLILLDGDLKSFSEIWLKKMIDRLQDNDYIVPNYSRSFQEGNTTNHFIYPLLCYHTGGKCPRQPIAGDFGLSKNYLNFLVRKASWHKYCYGYGIDIFLTINALYNKFKICEVSLDKKVHKPSFDKTINMFIEVASSYYETSRTIFLDKKSIFFNPNIETLDNENNLFKPNSYIDEKSLKNRLSIAKKIMMSDEYNNIFKIAYSDKINKDIWCDYMTKYESKIGEICSSDLANSILPLFLLRTVDYLKNNQDVVKAQNDINKEAGLLLKARDKR